MLQLLAMWSTREVRITSIATKKKKKERIQSFPLCHVRIQRKAVICKPGRGLLSEPMLASLRFPQLQNCENEWLWFIPPKLKLFVTAVQPDQGRHHPPNLILKNPGQIMAWLPHLIGSASRDGFLARLAKALNKLSQFCLSGHLPPCSLIISPNAPHLEFFLFPYTVPFSENAYPTDLFQPMLSNLFHLQYLYQASK